MSATFDPTLPTLTDHIRLALGDRHSESSAGAVESPLLQDQTIQAKIDAFGYLEALAQLAEALVSEFAQQPDNYSESGGIHIQWSERIKSWRELAIAARSGRIPDPDAVRRTRSGSASATLTAQATLSQPGVTGFRSD